MSGDAQSLDEPLLPAEQLTREQRRSRRKRDVRARTINVSRLPKRDLDLGRQLYPEAVERPLTRAECKGSERPCPYVGCAHHLYLDVSPENGSIKLNFPDLEPDEMAHSCALDEADRGGLTLEAVGAILNITRERVRQIEVDAYAQLAAQPGVPELFANYLDGETREVEAIERQPERPAPRRLPVLPRPEPSIEPMKQEEPAGPAEDPMSRCSARDCNKIVRLGKLKEPPPPGTEDLCLDHRRAFLKKQEPGGEGSPPKGIAAFLEGEEKKKQRAAPRPSPSPCREYCGRTSRVASARNGNRLGYLPLVSGPNQKWRLTMQESRSFVGKVVKGFINAGQFKDPRILDEAGDLSSGIVWLDGLEGCEVELTIRVTGGANPASPERARRDRL